MPMSSIRRGRLIADPDLSLVLRETDLVAPAAGGGGAGELVSAARRRPASHTAAGPAGGKVLTAYAPVPRLDWIVFVELPLARSAGAGLRLAVSDGGAAGARPAAGGGAGTMLARRMVVPIRRLQIGRRPARFGRTQRADRDPYRRRDRDPGRPVQPDGGQRYRNRTKPSRPRSRRAPRRCRRASRSRARPGSPPNRRSPICARRRIGWSRPKSSPRSAS